MTRAAGEFGALLSSFAGLIESERGEKGSRLVLKVTDSAGVGKGMYQYHWYKR